MTCIGEMTVSEDRCVCCGEIIPEGTHVCSNCRSKAFPFEPYPSSCYYSSLVGERPNQDDCLRESGTGLCEDCHFYLPNPEMEAEMREYTLEAAIETLKDVYEKAQKMDCVFKPVSWALYQTWRFADQVEKPNLGKRKPQKEPKA